MSSQGLPVPTFPALGLQVCITMPGFYFFIFLSNVGSGLHACMPSTVSPLPNLEFIFFNATYDSMGFWEFPSYVALKMWRLQNW